jgi:hypothetical protein
MLAEIAESAKAAKHEIDRINPIFLKTILMDCPSKFSGNCYGYPITSTPIWEKYANRTILV